MWPFWPLRGPQGAWAVEVAVADATLGLHQCSTQDICTQGLVGPRLPLVQTVAIFTLHRARKIIGTMQVCCYQFSDSLPSQGRGTHQQQGGCLRTHRILEWQFSSA